MSIHNHHFKELLKPGKIGQMELKNRIVMAPMGTYLAGRDGLVTERLIKYYEARARGGAALIIAGVASIDYPRGRVMTRQLGISDDKFITGLAELAKAVHLHRARLGIQLQHGGRIAAPFLSGGHEAVGPSVIPLVPKELGLTRELTASEIGQLIQRFAEAAERAQRAGIDGVEIHAGHGYLISEFLSRSTNLRKDEYGGSLEKRARFLIEIITAVRNKVGPDYPVWCRLDGREFGFKDGLTQEEAQQIGRLVEKASADAIHVSGYGGSEGAGFTEAPLVYQPCHLVPLARGIKKLVSIPVIAVGRISPESGEKLIREGGADFIAMGRQLLADPETPLKLASGRLQDIRRCIYCYSCVHQIFVRSNICCAINPLVGKESEPAAKPAEKVKKVMVVGGGPAGLQASIVAAQRGHQVRLYEKTKQLGGSLQFASIVRKENEDLKQYLVDQVKWLKIAVTMDTEVTPELVEQIKPDVVIIATGSRRNNPAIPGIDGRNVINGDDLRLMMSGGRQGGANQKNSFAQKAIMRVGVNVLGYLGKTALIRRMTHLWMPLGRKVVILGAGMVGLELALFLVERRREVIILENSDQIGTEMPLPFKWMTMDKLNQKGVQIICEVKYEKITRKAINIQMKDGAKREIMADNIVVACGAEADQLLVQMFLNKAVEVYPAGDCSKLSYIKDSIAEGFRIGSDI